MDADWRRKIKEIYLAASGQEPEARQGYLDEACGDDEAMRREVESLLLERDQIETPARLSVGVESNDRPPSGPGASIGRYRIISLVGEGGMGRVYEAEDPELR